MTRYATTFEHGCLRSSPAGLSCCTILRSGMMISVSGVCGTNLQGNLQRRLLFITRGDSVFYANRQIARRPALLDLLFDSSPILRERIRRHYVLYASHLENTLRPGPQIPDIPAHAANARVQVFLAQPEGYSEVATMIQTVEAGQWNKLTFNLPTGTGGGPLRIDPADCPCVIELDRISIIEVESGNVLWSAEDPAALRSLAYSGSAALLDQEERCLLFSYGDDPQLQLPPVSDEGKQVSVTISLRLDRTLEAVVEALNSHAELLNMVSAAQSEVVDLRGNVNSAQSERQRIEAELSTVTTELDNIRREAESARLQAQSESVQRFHRLPSSA